MAADHMGENNFDMCLNIWEKFGYKEDKTVGNKWATLLVQNNTLILIDICYVDVYRSSQSNSSWNQRHDPSHDGV